MGISEWRGMTADRREVLKKEQWNPYSRRVSSGTVGNARFPREEMIPCHYRTDERDVKNRISQLVML